MDISLIILSAGSSNRFNQSYKKQWLRSGNKPLWQDVAQRFEKSYKFKKIILTSANSEIDYMKTYSGDYEFVIGGNTRQQSLKNALKIVDTKYILVTDVARACVPKKLIRKLINSIDVFDIVVPYISVTDSIIYKDNPINREDAFLIQTPQLSKTNILKKALKTTKLYTDDSSAIKAIGGKVKYIKGNKKAHKLTTIKDIKHLSCLKNTSKEIFIGYGVDIHEFEANKKMFLGGIKIDVEYGFKAHSDGDVLIHALIDSLFGAIGAGDIGEHFPDNDIKYKDIDSKKLLKHSVDFLRDVGYEIINTDITILAQKPKLLYYKIAIKKKLSSILNIDLQKINIKATTTEKLGFVGREEGIMVQVATMVKYQKWGKN